MKKNLLIVFVLLHVIVSAQVLVNSPHPYSSSTPLGQVNLSAVCPTFTLPNNYWRINGNSTMGWYQDDAIHRGFNFTHNGQGAYNPTHNVSNSQNYYGINVADLNNDSGWSLRASDGVLEPPGYTGAKVWFQFWSATGIDPVACPLPGVAYVASPWDASPYFPNLLAAIRQVKIQSNDSSLVLGVHESRAPFTITATDTVAHHGIVMLDIEKNGNELACGCLSYVQSCVPAVPSYLRYVPLNDFHKAHTRKWANLYCKWIDNYKQAGGTKAKPIGLWAEGGVRPASHYYRVPGDPRWKPWDSITGPHAVDYMNKECLDTVSFTTINDPITEKVDYILVNAYQTTTYASGLGISNYLNDVLASIEYLQHFCPTKKIMTTNWVLKMVGGATLGEKIDAEQAEALAVFSMVAGDGLQLWDQGHNSSYNYSAAEHYVNGLYRLSAHNSILGDLSKMRYRPENAWDVHLTNPSYPISKPVWRAIYSPATDSLLVVATHPGQNWGSSISIPITYTIPGTSRTFSQNITLNGREIFIGAIKMPGMPCSAPSAPSISSSAMSLCGGSATLTASGCSGGTINWTGGGIGTTKVVTSSGTYQASCTLAGCTSTLASITISAGIAPSAPSVVSSSAQSCLGTNYTLTASSCPGGTIKWADGTIGATKVVTSSGTYLAECIIGGCVSTQSWKTVGTEPTCSVCNNGAGLPTAPTTYVGKIESIDCNGISGFALDNTNPSANLNVDLYINGYYVATTAAYVTVLNRTDLASTYGNPLYATKSFYFNVQQDQMNSWYRNGTNFSYTVKFRNTSTTLPFTSGLSTVFNCSGTGTGSCFLTTSLSTLSNFGNLTIYPNPANDQISVVFQNGSAEADKVVITNLLGQTVITSKNFKDIYIKDLATGNYFINVLGKNNEVLSSSKFIKE